MLLSTVVWRSTHGLRKSNWRGVPVRWLANSSSNRSTPQEKDEYVKHIIPKAFGVGTLAGVCGSLAGMGGGFIMIPLMTSSLIRLTQHQAHGTSLFAVTTTGLAGALGYSGNVQFEAAAVIACCGMVTARFGANMTTKISEKALKKALGIFMLCVAPLVPAKMYLMDQAPTVEENDADGAATPKEKHPFPQRVIAPAIIGIFSGFLAGLFGVGGGAIVVPALTIATDMTHYQSLATSLCAMSLPAMVGTATHYSKGNVAMRVAPALAMGAFVGGFVGGKIGLQTNENLLRWGFSGLMVVLGARTLM
jgi:uncharacterized membrane protein YfcA